MNHVALIGRLTKDPEIRKVSGNGKDIVIAKYSLAVDKRYKKDGEPNADFIRCVVFGKTAEFTEKYLHQGSKIAVEGRIQTGNYKDKDGKIIYTTDVVVENCEFAESKRDGGFGGGSGQSASSAPLDAASGDFMSIPDDVSEELPFN